LVVSFDQLNGFACQILFIHGIFLRYNIEDENQAIAKVSFELIDNVTHTATEFTTDEKGGSC
jgi:hypothetical protein